MLGMGKQGRIGGMKQLRQKEEYVPKENSQGTV